MEDSYSTNMQKYSLWILAVIILVGVVALAIAIPFIIRYYRNRGGNDDQGGPPGTAVDEEILNDEEQVVKDAEAGDSEQLTKDNEELLADKVKIEAPLTKKVSDNIKKMTKKGRKSSVSHKPTVVRDNNGEIILGDLSTSEPLGNGKVLREAINQRPRQLSVINECVNCHNNHFEESMEPYPPSILNSSSSDFSSSSDYSSR